MNSLNRFDDSFVIFRFIKLFISFQAEVMEAVVEDTVEAAAAEVDGMPEALEAAVEVEVGIPEALEAVEVEVGIQAAVAADITTNFVIRKNG